MRTLFRISLILLCLGLLLGENYRPGVAQSRLIATTKPTVVGAVETPIPILPLVTTTPDANGEIIHVVQYGQTLITIAEAYGVPLLQLKELNQLDNDAINVGDKLLIRKGATPTVTETPTITATATRRPTATLKARTPTSTAGPLPTVTATLRPTSAALPFNITWNRKSLGIGIIVVCLAGLVLVGLTAFRGK